MSAFIPAQTLREARKLERRCWADLKEVFKEIDANPPPYIAEAKQSNFANWSDPAKAFYEDLRKNPLHYPMQAQTSHIFRSKPAAEHYYERQGSDREEVERKIKDKEIAIGTWQAGYVILGWDGDDRAIIELPSNVNKRNIARALEEKRQQKADLWGSALESWRAFKRADPWLKSKTYEVRDVPTKGGLLDLLKVVFAHSWTEDTPYCCYGCPHYDQSEFDKQYAKPANNRVYEIHHKGATVIVTKHRMLLNGQGSHWGMRDTMPLFLIWHKGKCVAGAGHYNWTQKQFREAVLKVLIPQ